MVMVKRLRLAGLWIALQKIEIGRPCLIFVWC